MAEYCLSGSLLDLFKHHARESFSDVKHSHLIEALARGFDFTTYAALNSHLKTSPASSEELRDFSTISMRQRLVELGYHESPAWPEHFGIPDKTTIAARAKVLNGRERTYWTLDELTEQGKLGQTDAQKLKTLVRRRATIIVSGLTGAGKSTLLCALLDERARTAPREQFVLVDNVVEFRGFPSNVFQMEVPVGMSQGEFLDHDFFRSGLKSATVVLGEIRDEAADNAILNWNVHGGGLGTIHARSASGALDRLTQLAEAFSSYVGRVDVVVQLARSEGIRGIEEIRMLNQMSEITHAAAS